MKKTLIAILLLMALASLSAAQEPVTLRFLCFQDRNECDVYADLLARFSDDVAGISVEIEEVAEAEVVERLLAANEADAGYDIARISDFAALHGHFLDLRPWLGDELDMNFRYDYFGALRTNWLSDAEELHGFPRCPWRGRALCQHLAV